ncbi:MAG: hypothetical protein IPM54_40925 [Polyangiaceae bacterium]|nr:hypothetical protein [Polyangiaceae bacterium]
MLRYVWAWAKNWEPVEQEDRELSFAHAEDARPHIEAHLRVAYQLVRCLRGRTRGNATTLSDRDFDEAKFEASLREKNLPFVTSYFHAVRLELAVLFGDYDLAVRVLEEADRYVDVAVAQYFATGVIFRGAFLAAVQSGQGSRDERAKWLADYERREAKLLALAESCPQNFRHRLDLVRAERARVEGRDIEALNLSMRPSRGCSEWVCQG